MKPGNRREMKEIGTIFSRNFYTETGALIPGFLVYKIESTTLNFKTPKAQKGKSETSEIFQLFIQHKN